MNIKNFVEILKREWKNKLVSVILFGSQASGKAKDKSDIDILIVREDLPKGLWKRKEIMDPIYEMLPEEFVMRLSPILLSPPEAKTNRPFYLDMTIHSEILYDRDNFFERILNKLRNRLEELKSERKIDSDGYAYWILKPDAELGEEIVL